MSDTIPVLFVDSGLPWVGAVLDGLLAVLPPFVAVVEHLLLRPHPERDPVRRPRGPFCPRHGGRTPENVEVHEQTNWSKRATPIPLVQKSFSKQCQFITYLLDMRETDMA